MDLKRILSLLIILSIAVIPGLFAQAHYDYINANIDEMKKELGLSDDQAKRISTIMLDSWKQIEEKHIALQRTMIDLREQLLKDQPNLTEIKRIIDRKSAVVAEIEFITIKRDLDIKAVLTPEQFNRWKSLRRPGKQRFFDRPFPPMHHDGEGPERMPGRQGRWQ
jgi:Spy/CpxP family protein refolding chaperone